MAMGGVKTFLVRAALALSLALPFYFAGAALATKFGLLDWRIGFGLMTLQVGPMLLLGAAGLAVIALLASLIVSPRRGWISALIALAIPGGALAYAGSLRASVATIPPIHDIVTDTAAPLVFSDDVIRARAATPGGNPVEADPRVPNDPRFGPAAGQRARELQAKGYPDIAPIELDSDSATAYEAALATSKAEGWTIVRADADARRIEAFERSFWFGFTDDIVIEVKPGERGARVDMRSTSRVGVSDLGVNAARVRALRDALAPPA
jgi:fatty-acyl-CoA synthase